jgi:predicted oxidoreductase
LGVWDKTYFKGNGKHDSRLRKQITTFDHADIYGSYTTEADFKSICFKQNSERKCN